MIVIHQRLLPIFITWITELVISELFSVVACLIGSLKFFLNIRRELTNAAIHTDELIYNIFFLLLKRLFHNFFVCCRDALVVGITIMTILIFGFIVFRTLFINYDLSGKLARFMLTFLHKFLYVVVWLTHATQSIKGILVYIVYLVLQCWVSLRVMLDAFLRTVQHLSYFLKVSAGHHILNFIQVFHHAFHVWFGLFYSLYKFFLWIVIILRVFTHRIRFCIFSWFPRYTDACNECSTLLLIICIISIVEYPIWLWALSMSSGCWRHPRFHLEKLSVLFPLIFHICFRYGN